MRVGRQIAMLALAGALCLPAAQDTQAPKTTSIDATQSPEAFGNGNHSCLEWTDGCTTCLRSDTGHPACSLPGIACQPASLSCSRKADAGSPQN